MCNFVRTAWGIECFLLKTEYGYKSWMILPSGLSDDEILHEINISEQKLILADSLVHPAEITVVYRKESE